MSPRILHRHRLIVQLHEPRHLLTPRPGSRGGCTGGAGGGLITDAFSAARSDGDGVQDDVCDEVVQDGLAGGPEVGVRFDVGRHVEGAGGGEGDDGGVSFGDEAVSAEAFDVED